VERVRFDGGDEVVAEVDDLQTSPAARQPVRRDRFDPIATEIDRLEPADAAQVDGRRQPVLLQVKSAQSPQRPQIVQPLQPPACIIINIIIVIIIMAGCRPSRLERFTNRPVICNSLPLRPSRDI